MSTTLSRLHILKLEVAHGSDRHEISMYNKAPPTVEELIQELERKTRVPRSQIQLLFKGQKLHLSLNASLSQFGIFSGSKLLMVGERLGISDDGIFRRVLGIANDIGLIEKSLNEAVKEFSVMQQGSVDQTLAKEYLPQLLQRARGMKQDLETFLSVIRELDIDESRLPDVHNHYRQTVHKIKENIQKSDKLIHSLAQLKN